MSDGYPTIEDLNEDILAYRQEIQSLREHLEDTLEENESLSAQIQLIGCDLQEERIENATREHALLRQNTPGVGSTSGLGTSRVGFYDYNREDDSPNSDGSIFEDIEPYHRANSVAGIRPDHVDSNRLPLSKRRSMSYHDIANVHQHHARRPHSYTDEDEDDFQHPEEDYQYDQEIGYFEDELVSSSYYAEEQVADCANCRETRARERELESHKDYLEEMLEDKDKFIENTELEVVELKTQLRSLKLDKDIVEYDLNEKVVQSTEKLKETTSTLKQKDQAYMDLLDRFVNLEKKFEDVNSRYKSNIKESVYLSDKLSLTEFDLIMAEERLLRYEKKLFDSESSSGGSNRSSPNSTLTKTPPKHRLSRKFSNSVSNLEQCTLDDQPLSISISEEEIDLSIEEEFQAIENIRKAKKEAERHAQIQEMLSGKKNVSAYDLFQITKELAGMADSETKENLSSISN